MTQGFGRKAEGSGLALILAFAAIGIGIIGWGSPAVPQNTCDGTLTKHGRCETGTTGNIVILAGQTQITKTITFSPAFTNIPYAVVTALTQPVFSVTPQITTDVAFLTAINFQYKIPVGASATEFPGNSSFEIPFDPSVYSTVQLSITVSTNAPSSGASMEVDYSSNGSVSWTTLVSFVVDLSAGQCNQVVGVTGLLCSGYVNMPAVTSATNGALRLATKNGDGTTVVTFNEIHAQFQHALSVPVYVSISTTASQMSIALQIPFTLSGTTTQSFKWTVVSNTG